MKSGTVMPLSGYPVLPATPHSAPDYPGMWYTARQRYGIDDHMLFGCFEPGSETPVWQAISHRFHDGLGGLVQVLKARGLTPPALPICRESAPPPWRHILRPAAPRIPDAKPDPRWRVLQPERAEALTAPPATILLTPDDTARLEAEAAAHGVNSNVWLLWTADRAVRDVLSDAGAILPWVFPVNLRGALRLPEPTMNHCGGLGLYVEEGMTPSDIRRLIAVKLARHEHWRIWYLFAIGRWIGQRGVNAFYDLTRPRPGQYAGSYTNLGEWTVPGLDGVICAAPCSPGYPVSIGTTVCNGRRCLSIRLHPVLARDDVAGQVLSRWRERALAVG